MRKQRGTSLLVLVVLVVVSACVIPNVTITDPIAQATFQALTIDAAIQATQRAREPASASPSAQASPTETPTASQTPTPTVTAVPSQTPPPTVTSTPIVIASRTAVVPSISVSVPTNCRSGPGKDYPIEGALLVGEIAQVLGRDPGGHYYYIPNPDEPGDYCWVWDGYATLSGAAYFMPILTPPPTPTATFTPTPSPSFDASYEGLVWCTGVWWTEIALANTGPLTFRSIEITLRDLQLDISVSDEADSFVDKPDCSSSSSRLSLQPDKTVTVSSPSLDNDPSGHKMRATITLCSKVDGGGECVTETLRFTP
ncbi:MAG TPA: SH3 domain-containing protein [Anaerolineales bacterium]